MPRRKQPKPCQFCPNPATTTLGGTPLCADCEPVARQVVRDKLDAMYAALQQDIDAHFAAQQGERATAA